MGPPEHFRQQIALQNLRAELRKITEQLLVDLKRRLGLDKAWIKRGRRR